MGHFISNVRDLEFNIFEVLGLAAELDGGAFGDLDAETARSLLQSAAELTAGPVAEAYESADRNPPTFDPATHSVSIPKDFQAAYNAMVDAGYWAMSLPEEIGGMRAPSALNWAIGEMLLGANPAAYMYSAGTVFSGILWRLGNEEQKRWAQISLDRRWGSTMVLTEPDAGSDVGSGRTTATEQADGSWHIEGVKRFITSADAGDMNENIFHLVLARPEGAGPGTKGLSLFYVPKFHFDTNTGELGERNGVFVTGVEKKMGLKVSATCELSFGLHGTPAKGWLVGDVHAGISQMFEVIEHARMMVGTKAIAGLSSGYLHALEYAKTRVQGADLAAGGAQAPRVSIMHHPDVRRSLMRQKSYAEGMRAVYLYTTIFQDPEVAQRLTGADKELSFAINDLLLPIVKGVGSERGYELLNESLQCFGGSGYLQDYPIEQYIRDSKIDSLYEGTTAIQAQDFFFRKIIRNEGKALLHISTRINHLLDNDRTGGALDAERAHLRSALEHVSAAITTCTGYVMAAQENPTEIYKVGEVSVRLLMGFGDLMIGWRLLYNAEVAWKALADNPDHDTDFYQGKIAAARWFAANELPGLATLSQLVSAADGEIMNVRDESF